MLVSGQCKTAGHGPHLFQQGLGWEDSLVKVAKLESKTTGHGPCLFWVRVWSTVWIRVQSYKVKLLAMVLVYSSGRRLGIAVMFGPKLFSHPKQTFITLITGPLSCEMGKRYWNVLCKYGLFVTITRKQSLNYFTQLSVHH